MADSVRGKGERAKGELVLLCDSVELCDSVVESLGNVAHHRVTEAALRRTVKAHF